MNKKIFLISLEIFMLFIFVVSVSSVNTEEEFNEQFCKDFAENFGDARRQPTIDKNFNACVSLMEDESLYLAISNKDYDFCSNLDEKLIWDEELKFFQIDRYNLYLTCQIYLASKTGNYGICSGDRKLDETRYNDKFSYEKKYKWVSKIDSGCISHIAIQETDLSILDNYNGVNPPNDGRNWVRAFNNFTDISQCETKWEYAESSCINYLNKDKPLSEENCGLLEDEGWRSKCLHEYAVENNDTASCLEITNNRKNTCIKDIAVNLKDVDTCKYFEDSDEIKVCKRQVPFAFKLNQIDRIIYHSIAPLLIFIFFVFVFLEERKIKEKSPTNKRDLISWIIATVLYILGVVLYFVSLSVRSPFLPFITFFFMIAAFGIVSFKNKPLIPIFITFIISLVISFILTFSLAIWAGSQVTTDAGLAAVAGMGYGVYISSWITIILMLIGSIISYKKHRRIYSLILMIIFIVFLIIQIAYLSNMFGLTCIGPAKYRQGCYYRYSVLHTNLKTCYKIQEEHAKEYCIRDVYTKMAIKDKDILICGKVAEALDDPDVTKFRYLNFHGCLIPFFKKTKIPVSECARFSSCVLQIECYSKYNSYNNIYHVFPPIKCSDIKDDSCFKQDKIYGPMVYAHYC